MHKMSDDRNNYSIEGCVLALAIVVITFILIVYLSIYTIIGLFIGSCVLSFVAGIAILVSETCALPDVVPPGQNKYFPVASFELFKKQNCKLLYEAACDAAKNTAMIMCCGKKKMRNEDIFVLDQKKSAREPWLTGCLGFIFVKIPMAGFYLIRMIFFGTPRDILNDDGENGPLDNDFVKGNILCVGLAYAVLFALAAFRYVANILFVAVYCIFNFLFFWTKKKQHNDHSFYHSAFQCRQCGCIHSDLGPSIMGAGVIFQECACGETFCAIAPAISKKLIAVCPICSKPLNKNR